jgi:beta-galactosidase
MRPLKHRVDVTGFEIEPLEDIARADALVARRIDELGLPTWPVDPVSAYGAVHEDSAGSPRVVFVMNPTESDQIARLSLAGVDALVDVVRGGRGGRAGGALEVAVPARFVKMMVVEGR